MYVLYFESKIHVFYRSWSKPKLLWIILRCTNRSTGPRIQAKSYDYAWWRTREMNAGCKILFSRYCTCAIGHLCIILYMRIYKGVRESFVWKFGNVWKWLKMKTIWSTLLICWYLKTRMGQGLMLLLSVIVSWTNHNTWPWR